ncbi:hypothetical protein DYB32_007014 [Aphanomyces invadans]|uniref:HTH CENPB-type domain-containing protein n=1 Tax=Aphanomyces invadans TaxID=157072 RepID=A0A3R6Z120_9STRA|nr:hypothetical protein DYB32_007014 [Aphanomyces invadans]
MVNDERSNEFIAKTTLTTRYNMQLPKLPELETELYYWIIMANAKHCSVTGSIILRKAENLAKTMGFENAARFSNGLLHRFQKRFGLRMFRLHG